MQTNLLLLRCFREVFTSHSFNFPNRWKQEDLRDFEKLEIYKVNTMLSSFCSPTSMKSAIKSNYVDRLS